MSLGVDVRTRTSAAGRGPTSLTDTAFVVGTPTGAVTTQAFLCRSIADYESNLGVDRTDGAALWDWLDVFFREGGKRAYVSAYDAAGITSTLADALGRFTVELGPGQVAAPQAAADAATYTALLAHAEANNRFAVLDVASAADTQAELLTFGPLVPTANEEYGALFGPWVEVGPAAGLAGGSDRTVPASAVACALIARADELGNPNRAPAGRDFPLQYASGFVYDLSLAEANALLNTGCNPLLTRYGVLQLYGFQTVVPSTEYENTPFWQANAVRARMWLKAAAERIGEEFMFKPIDGRGILLGRYAAALGAVAHELYAADGLYGETPGDAYAVDVSASVNTVNDAAQGVLEGVLYARYSPHTKSVALDLVSIPVTGAVGA